MGKGIAIGIIVVIVVLVLIFSFGNFGSDDIDTATTASEDDHEHEEGVEDSHDDEATTGAEDDTEDSAGTETITPQTHTVEVQLFQFFPTPLNIKAGDTVVFLSVDSAGRWVAGNTHPTHRDYPGSDISKCGTAEESMIFDSCGPIAQGDSYSFTFNEIGTWKYHDHLISGTRGTIVVS